MQCSLKTGCCTAFQTPAKPGERNIRQDNTEFMRKAYPDLRSFLNVLEEEGQLVRVKEEVMPEPDIAAAGRAAANIKNGPAV